MIAPLLKRISLTYKAILCLIGLILMIGLSIFLIRAVGNSRNEERPLSINTHRHYISASVDLKVRVIALGTMTGTASTANPYEIELWDVTSGKKLREWQVKNALDLA